MQVANHALHCHVCYIEGREAQQPFLAHTLKGNTGQPHPLPNTHPETTPSPSLTLRLYHQTILLLPCSC